MAYDTFFPRRIHMYVASLSYVADESFSPAAGYKVQFGAPLALSATYFLNAGQMVNGSAFVAQTLDGSLLNNGLVPGTSASVPSLWGRGLTFVASGACTRSIVVLGWDYLGQRMAWHGTMNGNTPVACPKAFM